LISYRSGSAQNEAMFLKNESILKQAEASDQFAFYQAKSVKGYIDEAVASLSTEPETKARYLAAKQKEDAEKAPIALAAITVLTRRRWLLWASVSAAVTGVVVAITALF